MQEPSELRTSLAELLTAQAQIRPEAPAIVDIDRSWTWAQADLAAGQLASALLDADVQPGERVGVHLYKCGEGFLAMHAVVRIGAVAVPLDPGSPTDRLVGICDAMQIQVLITHEPRSLGASDIADRTTIRTIIGATGETSAERTVSPAALDVLTSAPPLDVDLDSTAYIITTSGSTGEPKGIMHSHRSAMAYATMSSDVFSLTHDDRVADIAPLHFDISTFVLWSCPLRGAAIVVMPEPYQRLPASLSQRLADEQVSIWYSVPFLLQQMVLRGDLEHRDLSALRWAQVGGEVIPPQMLGDFLRMVPTAKVANVYGPAETNHCSTYVISEPPPLDELIPIGAVCSDTEFWLSEPGARTPGEDELSRGELWVSSRTLMQSYSGRSEADSNISVIDGVRWYRTGDLVSLLDDGIYVFEGRADNQVKVRGHRVELEWIESVLETFDGIEAAVATTLRSGDGIDQVVAGVTGADGVFNEREFLLHAAARLPSYATPARAVTLSGISTTTSGKLDRRAMRHHVRDHVRGL